jgi:hypothetical protein
MLTGSDYELDFLFIAETFNGNIIKQDPTDKPKFSKSGSIFTDVLKEKIKRFSLIGKGHIFVVDLTDGHMEVDGKKLYPPKKPPITPLDLIYYRQVERRLSVGTNNATVMQPIVRYYLGWQINFHGKNHKWEMGVD